MKYNIKTFNKEVEEFKKILKGKVEEKVVFIEIKLGNKEAYYSLAPLSRAIHDLDGEMQVIITEGESENLKVLKRVWRTNNDRKKKLKTNKVKALSGFINNVIKRTKNKSFIDIFDEPDIYLVAREDGFSGTLKLKYRSRWRKRYRWKDLLETAKTIWKLGYDLKKSDTVSVGFVLIPAEKNLELPLEDYLDSFSIARAMAIAAKKIKTEVGMGTSSDKFSVLARPVRTVELIATLRGCELSKNLDEEVFEKFKILSKILHIDKLRNATASFGVHGKGYHGKHFFGEAIGYPTLNKKTRWTSPGSMMLKDRYAPQAPMETRDPMMRHAVTETLPIDVFIETCNVDYSKIRKRSGKIKKILDKCDYVRIIGEHIYQHKTDFTVHLVDEKGNRREITAQDSDVRTIIDQEHFKKTGKKCGAYANFPSGEAFTTPECVEGIIVGDVVINIDQSYLIPEKSPIVIQVDKIKGHNIVSAPEKLLKTMRKEWKEARQKISNMEQAGSIPKELTNMYKRNFKKIGEFAINTNPKAKLSNYLIVNEKIARMIHIALGMGFAPDRATVYHWDIVINSPKQKLDIYGVDKNKKTHWVIKKGKFVV